MVRKDELPETSEVDKQVSKYLLYSLRERRLSTADVEKALGRSHGYTYTRTRGQESFTIDELTKIARLLGLNTFYDFMDEAQKFAVADEPERVETEN